MTIHSISLWLGKSVNLKTLWEMCGQTWILSNESILVDHDYDLIQAISSHDSSEIVDFLSDLSVWNMKTANWDAVMVPHDQMDSGLFLHEFLIGVNLGSGGIDMRVMQSMIQTFGLDPDSKIYIVQDDCRCCS